MAGDFFVKACGRYAEVSRTMPKDGGKKMKGMNGQDTSAKKTEGTLRSLERMFKEAPDFDLGQVVIAYEDEDVAVVVKPQGIPTFAHREHNKGKKKGSAQNQAPTKGSAGKAQDECKTQTKSAKRPRDLSTHQESDDAYPKNKPSPPKNPWRPNLKTVLFYLLSTSSKKDAMRLANDSNEDSTTV